MCSSKTWRKWITARCVNFLALRRSRKIHENHEPVRHWLLRNMYPSRLHEHVAKLTFYVMQENDKEIMGINSNQLCNTALLKINYNNRIFFLTEARKKKYVVFGHLTIGYRLSPYADCVVLLYPIHVRIRATSRECAFNEAEITRLLSSLWVVKLGTSWVVIDPRNYVVVVVVAIVATSSSPSPWHQRRGIQWLRPKHGKKKKLAETSNRRQITNFLSPRSLTNLTSPRDFYFRSTIVV